MKKRVSIVLVVAAALCGGVSAAHAGTATGSSTWGCVVSSQIDTAVCLHDPIPHPLPTVNLPVAGPAQ